MQEHHGQPGLFLRDLVEHVGMVHVGRLTGARFLPLVFRLKRPFRSQCDAAGGKDALFRYGQGAGAVAPIALRLGLAYLIAAVLPGLRLVAAGQQGKVKVPARASAIRSCRFIVALPPLLLLVHRGYH